MLGVGGLVGTATGGLVGQWLFNARQALLPLFMGAAAIAGTVPFLVLLNLPAGRSLGTDEATAVGGGSGGSSGTSGVLGGGADWHLLGWYLAVAFVSGLLITMTGGNVRAMVQNCTPPRARGTAFARKSKV